MNFNLCTCDAPTLDAIYSKKCLQKFTFSCKLCDLIWADVGLFRQMRVVWAGFDLVWEDDVWASYYIYVWYISWYPEK